MRGPKRRALPTLPAAEPRFFDVAADARVLAHCNWQPDRKSAPTLLALHGLEGSSEAHYMRGLADKAFAAGFNVVRLNQRNCGGTEHLSRGLYHSGLTADPLFVLNELRDRDGLSRFAVAGYSLGGNITMKLAGELGERDVSRGEGVRGGVAGDRARRLHAVDRAAREPHLRVEFLPQPAGPHAPQGEALSRRSSISTGCGRCGRSARSTIAIPRRTMATTAPTTTTIAPARCA